MRSWRSTLIAGVAIPASIISTFAFMNWFGFTLNNVTMLALVLMVGVVIDDAIVVLENVFHCIEEKGLDPIQASIEGTREIGPAVLATTLSLVIVFLPVSFLSSVTGRMLYEFGITATVAIMVSMLVSFTLTPMMCSKLLTRGMANPNAPTSRGGFYYWIDASYMWMLRLSMRHRWAVLLLSVLTVAANWPLYQMVKQDYIPTNVDESEFEVSIYAREGASLVSMDEVMAGIEKQLQEMPGVEMVLATVGTRGFGGVNRGEVYVRLQDIETRTFSLGRLWNGLLKGDPGEAFRGHFSQRDMMAKVRSMTRQAEFSEKMRLAAREIPGIVDVDTTLKLDKPELLVHIDREKAAALGVSAREIAETLRVAVGGDRVSRYRDKTVDDAYDVELRLIGIDRRDVESISQLYVRANPQMDSSDDPASTNGNSSSVHTRIDNRRIGRPNRPAGPPAHGGGPSQHCRRICPLRPHRGHERGRPEDRAPAGL
jgi:HAE1 family hydrophobic/amphiphilic exporter-1